ncbi:unnamed protein product [Plutella xylostella]|uniref:(diamondback moth) hypothetical protein n=1 Tax=Plutella xylostella TaxID=51655 RepID=A0A8S4FVM3_PLUXY|nr:unnamed protein product [Plutella xylostella]
MPDERNPLSVVEDLRWFLADVCSGKDKMSAAPGGLKHVATEPAQIGGKRERRRVPSGRAAALRRAPSDSDCSGETASLSADSAERAPRAPPTLNKSRSRRRGSEWEVLEGLKDGQRFEKRPEVFNGYLHKKRKWPLKGWHKRFFVIDGGILVYARSPTDVARGRLHGSVDVGRYIMLAQHLAIRTCQILTKIVGKFGNNFDEYTDHDDMAVLGNTRRYAKIQIVKLGGGGSIGAIFLSQWVVRSYTT